jgi:hypothetical protein
MLQGMVWQTNGGSIDDSGAAKDAASEATGGDDEPAPWVTVLSAFNMVQATIAIARLGDEGIPARPRQEAASTALPVNAGILSRIDVLVPEPMAEKALAVLDALDELEGDVGDEEIDPPND